MATKSILKNINISGRGQGRKLINALENAERYNGKDVTLSRSFSEIKGEDVRRFFGTSK